MGVYGSLFVHLRRRKRFIWLILRFFRARKGHRNHKKLFSNGCGEIFYLPKFKFSILVSKFVFKNAHIPYGGMLSETTCDQKQVCYQRQHVIKKGIPSEAACAQKRDAPLIFRSRSYQACPEVSLLHQSHPMVRLIHTAESRSQPRVHQHYSKFLRNGRRPECRST